MKTEFVEVKTRRAALTRAPWAAKLVNVIGGYMAFGSMADYRTWQNQR